MFSEYLCSLPASSGPGWFSSLMVHTQKLQGACAKSEALGAAEEHKTFCQIFYAGAVLDELSCPVPCVWTELHGLQTKTCGGCCTAFLVLSFPLGPNLPKTAVSKT